MNHQDELPLAKVSEVDEAKRQWLQGMRHPVDTVTEPEPAEILAEFIRQHSAAGQLVARAVFLSPPYSVAEEELSVLLESIKQNGDHADIACLTGSQDDYYYSTQAMSENYAAMSLQVVEQDICRAIAHAVRFECQTYPRPYKVAMLMHITSRKRRLKPRSPRWMLHLNMPIYGRWSHRRRCCTCLASDL